MKRRKVNLKQFFCLLTTIICCVSLLQTAPTASSQQKEPDKPKPLQDTEPREYVEVVNVALILRALKKGQPVAGLQQTDFTLYEDGKPVVLTSFREVRRKVGQHAGEETAETRVEKKPAAAPAAPAAKKRLFFFYFRISEPDPKIQNALDYFFRQVYREGDYALLMFGNRVFPITRRSQVEPVLSSFNTALAQFVENARSGKQRLTSDLERLVRQFLEESRKNPNLQEHYVSLLISRFKIAWQEYIQKNLILAEEKLNAISASLKKIDIEKWGFVFYQEDRFPFLHLNSIRGLKGSALKIVSLRSQLEQLGPNMNQIQQSVQTIRNFQQAFIEANATFHLLLSNPTSMGKLDTIYLKHTAIHTDWQWAFRSISEATGGGIIKDNNLPESLAQAVEREDVFYVLTYAPAAGGDERRNIRIRTKLPGIKLQYHRQVTVSPADKIAIDLFSFNHPLLEFTLKNYRQFFDGTRLYGDIEVKITSVDANGNRRTFKKILEPVKDEMAVSMNMNFPSGGDYSLIIEANDRQTGQKAVVSQKIAVPESKYQLEPVLVTEALEEMKGAEHKRTLDSLLKKSARYCQKLKRVTFYFTCTEAVIDSHWYRGGLVRKDRCLYDYQIIREENGKMNENRKLKPGSIEFLGKKKKEIGKAKEEEIILTNFFSSYPFLMPISMLAEENQSKYRYRLLNPETIARRTLYKVSVEPKEEGVMVKDSNYGVVWIDGEDGSVYKIKLDANSLGGVKKLKQLARAKRNRLKLTDVHWYEVQRKGIRFPSRTEINCSFLDWDQVKRVLDRLRSEALEQVGTVFEYKKYKFFNVNVDVVETGHK
jgi:hypothetical protein